MTCVVAAVICVGVVPLVLAVAFGGTLMPIGNASVPYCTALQILGKMGQPPGIS